MAAADFDTQDFDLNAIAFDSTIAVSDHDWKEDHSNLDGFFVFGFTNQNTGQPFCHAFPLNGMGSNWDYNHFYEYEAASYDFYYYDRQRIPQYTDVYPDYFPDNTLVGCDVEHEDAEAAGLTQSYPTAYARFYQSHDFLN